MPSTVKVAKDVRTMEVTEEVIVTTFVGAGELTSAGTMAVMEASRDEGKVSGVLFEPSSPCAPVPELVLSVG